jgi:aminoglycoside 3-N-acetyltransferase
MYSREQLANHARDLGIRDGDLVMVHASVRAVGRVAGGPDQIHLALKDAVGESGSILMYASCPDGYDEVGRDCHPPETEAELLAKLPPFDARTARSQRDNGALVELLRTWPGVVANDHVARFVCHGPHTGRLFSTQPWDLPFGRGSALEHLVDLGGRILLLGSDHDAVTFLHYAEHIVDVPDKRLVRYQVPVIEDGQRVWRWCSEFDTAHPAHANWPEDLFRRITDEHLGTTGNAGGRIGDAPSHLIEAGALLADALDTMRRLA